MTKESPLAVKSTYNYKGADRGPNTPYKRSSRDDHLLANRRAGTFQAVDGLSSWRYPTCVKTLPL